MLRQAAEVKMMEEYQSYIITSTLDAHTLDFEELKFSRANITTLRLIDPTSYDISNGSLSFRSLYNFHTHFLLILCMCAMSCVFSAIHDWIQGERRHQRIFQISPEDVKIETALYHGEQSAALRRRREKKLQFELGR